MKITHIIPTTECVRFASTRSKGTFGCTLWTEMTLIVEPTIRSENYFHGKSLDTNVKGFAVGTPDSH